MINPKIRIKKSFLLNDKVIPFLAQELKESGREEEAKDEFIDTKVREYQEAWSQYDERITTAMCQVLGVEFNQNIIDVYVAPFGNSFSDPMVVSTKYTADRAVEVLTHEIAHRLLSDNDHLPMRGGRTLSEHWTDLFNEDDFMVLVHIPVHALLRYLFLDVLDEPGRLQRDIELCSKYPPYKQAWDYVEKHGYMEIIKQLRESYGS